MDFKLASSIYHKPWLIEGQAAIAYLELLEQIKAGTAKFEKPETPQLQLFASLSDAVIAPSDKWSQKEHSGYEGKSMAIMVISGPLMKEDYCGYFGTESMRGELKRIKATESIKDILFIFSTPGGAVDGTEAFANEIADAKQETWGIVYGQVCSAGMWLFTSCKHRVATSQTDIIGSIGTMFSIVDRSAQMEDQGIVVHEYYADASKDKNKMVTEAKKGKGRLLIEQLLNPMNDILLSAVRKNLGGDLNEEEVFTGKTFLTNDAIKHGLVQSYSPFDKIVNSIVQKQKTSYTMKISSTFKNIMALIGLSASTGDVELTPEQLQQIDAALPELETTKAKVTELETAATASTEKITGLEGSVAAITKERDDAKAEVAKLTAEVARLGNLDGGKITKPKAEGDKFEDEKGEDAIDMAFQKNLLNQI